MLDISKRYDINGNMAQKKSSKKKQVKQKLLEIPPRLHDVIAKDAERCRRSVNKQIEAILVAYYRIDSVELDAMAGVKDTVEREIGLTKLPPTGTEKNGNDT